ncbi:MAG: ABC transporter permease [Gemmatimonadaceae bacterium]|nr:ABC transporter permease [Gemmatimonadaceae bacterium]
MMPDFRVALRALARTPLSSAAAVLTLALGIGATTAIYGVVEATMLRALPWQGSDRLMDLSITVRPPNEETQAIVWSYPKFETMRSLQRSYEGVAAYTTQELLLSGGDGSERLRMELVSGNYFTLLRAPLALGRGLQPGDDTPQAAPVAVLSHALFMRRFGGDSSLIGRTIVLERDPVTVVGVAPAGFRGLSGEVALWAPISAAPRFSYPEILRERWNHSFDAVGRLRDGVSAASASAEMLALGRQVEAAHPLPEAGDGAVWGARAVTLREAREDASLSRSVLVLFGAVACVLLIACVNVANLLLARAAVRTREFAVRVAIGARRSQVAAQLLAETLLLSLTGGVLGILVASWSTEAVRTLVPASGGHLRTQTAQFLDLSAVRLDGRVLAFGLALSLVTGTLCGVVPALRASRPRLGEALKDGAGASSEGGLTFRRGRSRALLVTGNVALSLLLLVGAGLLSRSFAKARGVDAGFDARGVYTMRVQPPRDSMFAGSRATAFRTSLVSRLGALPGVTAVGTDECAPLSEECPGTIVLSVDGVALPESGARPSIGVHVVNDGYLKAVGGRLIAGRFLDARDREGAPMAAVINLAAAQRLFPRGDAVGKSIGIGFGAWNRAEIVGVIDNINYGAVGREPHAEFYGSYLQVTWGRGLYFMRTAGDPMQLAASARSAVRAESRDLAVYDERTLEQRAGSALGRIRFGAYLLGAFALLGLVLAIIGIYAALAYTVSLRTRELGIRMALGAVRREVVTLIMGRAMLLASVGAAVGLALAWGGARLLRGLVFGISATDPLTFATQTLLILLVCALAAYLPARRASRLDPVQALRSQ